MEVLNEKITLSEEDAVLDESYGKGYIETYKGYRIIDAGDNYVITDENGLNVGETKWGIPVIHAMIDEFVKDKEEKKSVTESFSFEAKKDLAQRIDDELRKNEIYTESGVSVDSFSADSDVFSIICTISGDWKHEHLFADKIVEEFLEKEGIKVLRENTVEVGEPSFSDYYTGEHHWFVLKNLTEDVVEKEVEVEETEKLPDVELEEPIVVSSEFDNDEVNDVIVKNAESMLISDTIQEEWITVDNYKSVIATLSQNSDNKEEAIALLNQIVDEKTIIIGMLTKVLELIDDKQVELMKQGVEKAEEVLDEVSDEKEEKEVEESLVLKSA